MAAVEMGPLLPGGAEAVEGATPDPFNRYPLVELCKLKRPKQCLIDVLLHVRRAQELPVQAVLSQGFAPDKKNGKSGVAGRRLLHAMCVLWRSYMRANLLSGGALDPPH